MGGIPLIPDYLTTFHPLLVHFPVALLFTAAVVEVIGATVPHSERLRHTGGILLGVGTLTLLPAYLTGRQAVDALNSPFPATELRAAAHSDWAWWTLLAFALVAALRLSLSAAGRFTGVARRTVAVLVVAALGPLILTADRGGSLVYDLGAGVRPVREAPEGAFDAPEESDPTELGPVEYDGELRWQFRPGSERVLEQHLRMLVGDLPGAVVQTREAALVLDLLAADRRLLTLGPAFENVSVQVEVDPTDFEGSFAIAHHVVDDGNFEFLRMRGGALELGRFRGGEEEILDVDDFDRPSGFFQLEVVGATTHFRGYVDGELRVHGHGESLPPGPVGLLIEGRGQLRIGAVRAVLLEE